MNEYKNQQFEQEAEKTISLLTEIQAVSPSPFLKERIMARLGEAEQEEPETKRNWFVEYRIQLVAGLILLAINTLTLANYSMDVTAETNSIDFIAQDYSLSTDYSY